MTQHNNPFHYLNPPGERAADCAFTHENLGAYALGAVDSFDRGLIDQHLRRCEACREDADALERTASAIPLSLRQEAAPDPAVWKAISEAIRSGNNLPKRVVLGDSPAIASSSTSVSHRAPHWAYVLLAPTAIALLVVSVWANSLKQDLDATHQSANLTQSMNQALFGRQGVQLTTMDQSCPECNGSGQLGYSATDRMGVVIGWNFNPDQQHDVWQVNPTGDRKRVCQLHIDEKGGVMQVIQLPESPTEYSEVIVTDANGQLIYVSHLLSPTTSGGAT